MLSNCLPSKTPAVPQLLSVGALTGIAILALFSAVAWRMAADDYSRARQAAGNLVGPAAMDIGRVIESYDLSLTTIVEILPDTRVSALPDDLRHLAFFGRSAIERSLGPVFVLDATGTVTLEAWSGSSASRAIGDAIIFLSISRIMGADSMSAALGCRHQGDMPLRSAAELTARTASFLV